MKIQKVVTAEGYRRSHPNRYHRHGTVDFLTNIWGFDKIPVYL